MAPSSAAAATIIDDFETGAFGPLTPGHTTPVEITQTGLPGGSVIGSSRYVEVFHGAGTSLVSAELTLSPADDGVALDVPAQSVGHVTFAWGNVFGAGPDLDLDLTAGGGDRVVVTFSAAPSSGANVGLLVEGSPAPFLEITGPGSYVFPFADLEGTPDLADLDWISARIHSYAFDSSPRTLTISDIRVVPEPGTALLVASGLLALGLRPRPRPGAR